MKVALIGQSMFASSVYQILLEFGHEIVAVFTIPDVNGREDPVAIAAKVDGVPVFKYKRWRLKGEILPEVFEEYKSLGAELNVLAYCSQFIPMEVINYPKYESICYHPSLLPAHRGASSINWTLIDGDKRGGFSIFWCDDGLDTGPILLQKSVALDADETIDSLYTRFLYPEGIQAMAEAVNLIADGQAPKLIQKEEGASYDAMLNKPELYKLDLENLPGSRVHNWIRGCDKVPGAWVNIDGKPVKLYGSTLWRTPIPEGTEIKIDDVSRPAILISDGLLLCGNDGQAVLVTKLGLDNGKMIPASKYGQSSEGSDIGQLSSDELIVTAQIKSIWESILNSLVEDSTDFFKSGAGSMDVTRLIEAVIELDQCAQIALTNEDAYMATTLEDFRNLIITKLRTGGDTGPKVEYDGITLHANKRNIKFPNQLFINNQFFNVHRKDDVDRAVLAAQAAFETGDWATMNARDRGKLLFKLADLMEQHKEELATLESLDSGAVYTLAIKTHVGMSIDTWKYFAGWCDKIQGSTIPINNARPNRNLTFTKREPIGVCGIITPWNYPLMMVSWKMAACLAAGNTVVLKPAQVSPLTALKLAELSVIAGFPPGVINILPGSGSVCGQAIADSPLIRKLGFTGSTPIGKLIMKSAAVSNLKRVSLELGGKSPLIIFKDADLDRAVRQAMSGVFFNKGENCIAAGRLFVERSIHDRFIIRVVREVKKMKIGNPLDRSTDHGPQNHRAHLEKLVEYAQIGIKEGAKLVYGGKQAPRPGLFFEPTIFCDVTDDMYIAKEESFGPIMIISVFDDIQGQADIERLIARANNTEFALASGVFTRDISKALLVSEKINAGTCFINCYNKTDVAAPFGGFKQSGFGKDLGQDALNEYLKTKTITVEY
ncbi:hypothetical protein RDWZM_000131 [Blomia tropicalis]|uniref:10-formyltetrahydrofolate dehydrogenase n=1 Tax=Blomia tropicalis TaxID=40697 RepID=A0A9Q0RPB7_BLOTA|nr:hypothetical protein RDWZM_000131 [Blomia tropicalis]